MLNLFKVGVTVQLLDRVSGGLDSIGTALDRAQKHTGAYQDSLKGLQAHIDKLSAIKSIGEMGFHDSVGMLDAMIDPAKEYTSQIIRMNMAGLEHETIAKNIGTAWEVAGKVMTTTATDNLKTLSELYGVITEKGGTMEEARNLLPRFQEMKMVLMAGSEHPIEGLRVEGLAYDAVKAAEMVGKTGQEGIVHMADMMEKVMIASGGKITPTDYQNFFKYAGQAKMSLSENELFGVLPELMIEMKSRGGGSGGSGGPGTMYASLFSTLVQGTMSKATAGHLQELGLMSGEMLKTTTTGTVAEGLTWKDVAGTDPSKWIMQKLIPAIMAKHPDLEGNEVGMAMEIAKVMKGPRKTTALIGEIFNKETAGIIAKFRENRERVLPHDQLVEQAKTSPRVLDASFAAQWESLMTVFGNEIMPFFTPMVRELTAGLKGVAAFMRDHKWVAQMSVMGVALGGLGMGILALGATAGLTAIAFAPLMAFLPEIGFAAGIAAAGVTWLGATFLYLQKATANIGNGIASGVELAKTAWTNFGQFAMETIATIIEQGGIQIAGLVSLFDQNKGAEIYAASTNMAQGLRDSTMFGSPKTGPYLSEIRDEQWQNGNGIDGQNMHHKHEVNIAAGAINVVAQAGQSAEEIAQKVIEEINKAILKGIQTSGPGIGIMSSPVFGGT